jgi:hypothetical protein
VAGGAHGMAAALVIDVGIRSQLYMVTTVPQATKLLPLNLSVSRIKPPAQLLPSEAIEHMLHKNTRISTSQVISTGRNKHFCTVANLLC